MSERTAQCKVWDVGWDSGGPVPCWDWAATVSEELQATGLAKRQITVHVKPAAAFPVQTGFLEIKVMETSALASI